MLILWVLSFGIAAIMAFLSPFLSAAIMGGMASSAISSEDPVIKAVVCALIGVITYGICYNLAELSALILILPLKNFISKIIDRTVEKLQVSSMVTS